jgi:hypothetical protein
LLEAHRLGFKRAIIPAAGEVRDGELIGMQLARAETVGEAIRVTAGERSAGAPAPV